MTSSELRLEGIEVGEELMAEEYTLEVNEDDAEEEGGGLGGSLLALESIGLLTQDAETDIRTLVDACNDFNNLRHLGMLWKVHHHWPAGVRFALNCNMHWAQVLLCEPGDAPVILLIR